MEDLVLFSLCVLYDYSLISVETLLLLLEEREALYHFKRKLQVNE